MRAQIAFAIFSKLMSYGAMRVTYAVSSFLTDDWGLSDNNFGLMLSVTELSGAVAGGVMGWISMLDSATVMTVTLMIQGITLIVTPAIGQSADVTTFFIVLMISRAVFGFTFDIYMVTLQTALTPPGMLQQQRDRVVALIEMPWAMSALVIVPLLGVVYGATDWRIMFMIPGGLLCVFAIMIPFLFRPSWVSTSLVTTAEGGHDDVVAHQTTPRSCAGFRTYASIMYNSSGFFWMVAANLIYTSFAMGIKRTGLNETQGGSLSIFLGIGEFLGATLAGLLYRDSSLEWMAGAQLLTLAFFAWSRQINLELAVFSVSLFLMVSETGIIQRFSRTAMFGRDVDSASLLGTQIQFQFVGRAVGAAVAPVVYHAPPPPPPNSTTVVGAWDGGSLDLIVASISTVLALITSFGARKALGQGKVSDHDDETSSA